MIVNILEKTWRHFANSTDKPEKFDKKTCEAKLIIEVPQLFLQKPNSVEILFNSLMDNVSIMRRFNFDDYSPELSTVSGPTVVLNPGSGIEELFPHPLADLLAPTV